MGKYKLIATSPLIINFIIIAWHIQLFKETPPMNQNDPKAKIPGKL